MGGIANERHEPMELQIRAATLREAAAVSQILTEAAVWLRELREPLWDLDQLTVDRVAPDCDAGLYFLAWSGATAVGTMRLGDSDPLFWPEASADRAVYLHRLAVRRAAAGGGVSSALLRHAARIADVRGARYLRLDVEAGRSKLREVYERFGFEFHSDHAVGGVRVARYQLLCTNPLR